MRFSMLASGSGGNACYVETGHTRILVDAGLSCREILKRMERVGLDPGNLDALVITHEHSDHIKGAGPVARRFHVPIYTNRKTLERGLNILGRLVGTEVIQTGNSFRIKDLVVETFTKCHDASDPFGLILASDGKRVGLATDLGRTTGLVEDRLRGCHALIMEFNYDPVMLEEGPYPLHVKRRIKGSDGHLSNGQAADILRSVCHEGLDSLVLAHLSKVNNHPWKAYEAAVAVLREAGFGDTKVLISGQDHPGPVVEI